MPTFTSSWRRFDFVLLALLLVLTFFGVVMIRSANLGTEDLADLWRRQATFAIIGLGLLFLVAAIPYEWLRHFWWIGYIVGIGLLVLVLFIGESEIGEVRRWFYIGTFRLQPSFPALILVIISLAAVLDPPPRERRIADMDSSRRGERPGLWRYLLSAALMIIPAALVFREPDLSTAVIFVAAWGVMVFVSEVHLGYLVGTLLIGLASLVPLWSVMEEYQRDRVRLFLHPERDPAALYNVDQALISIGSGGLWGKGYGVGSQSQLRFLRVRHTDYIFSVVGEEMGFIGATLLLFLFFLLFTRIFRAALLAPDRFGRLMVVGIGTVLFFQMAVNIGMNLGLIPVTGLPLPFISYGGSALLTAMVGLGLVEGVAMRHKEK